MTRPNPKIYGPIERLVPVEVQGHVFSVPEGIPVIRALQYIQFELGRMNSDWSRFCFNDTIGCCDFECRLPGEAAPAWRRACNVRVVPGLVVTTLPQASTLTDEAGDAIASACAGSR